MRTKILGASEVQSKWIQSESGSKVINILTYRQAHVKMCAKAFLVPHESKRSLVMEVNHGRWAAKCPECNSGIMGERLWTEARCFDCGAIYTKVFWPRDIDEIEAVLLLRPLANQNWLATETVGELVIQNLSNNLTKGISA